MYKHDEFALTGDYAHVMISAEDQVARIFDNQTHAAIQVREIPLSLLKEIYPYINVDPFLKDSKIKTNHPQLSQQQQTVQYMAQQLSQPKKQQDSKELAVVPVALQCTVIEMLKSGSTLMVCPLCSSSMATFVSHLVKNSIVLCENPACKSSKKVDQDLDAKCYMYVQKNGTSDNEKEKN